MILYLNKKKKLRIRIKDDQEILYVYDENHDKIS